MFHGHQENPRGTDKGNLVCTRVGSLGDNGTVDLFYLLDLCGELARNVEFSVGEGEEICEEFVVVNRLLHRGCFYFLSCFGLRKSKL